MHPPETETNAIGRPSKNLSVRVTVRMTPEELQRLREAADAAAVDLASFARSRLLDGEIPARARRKSVDHQALARVLAQLGKIGGNLNQAVKAANTNFDTSALRSSNEMKAELEAIRKLVREALGQ